jgi:hypothetical protein
MKLIYFFFPFIYWIDNIDEETKPSWKKHLHELFTQNTKNMKTNFTRKEVVAIIEGLREMPDVLIDSVQNENTNYDSERLLEIALKQFEL